MALLPVECVMHGCFFAEIPVYNIDTAVLLVYIYVGDDFSWCSCPGDSGAMQCCSCGCVLDGGLSRCIHRQCQAGQLYCIMAFRMILYRVA